MSDQATLDAIATGHPDQAVRVTRTLVMEGRAKWIRDTLSRCWVAPDQPGLAAYGRIDETTREIVIKDEPYNV